MRNTVKIEGCTYTRAQVAEGFAKLNDAQAQLDAPRTVDVDGVAHRVDRQMLANVRAALEKAQQELDAPEPLVHLTRVRHKADRLTGVVLIGGYVQETYRRATELFGRFTVVGSDGSGFTYRTEEDLRHCWEEISK